MRNIRRVVLAVAITLIAACAPATPTGAPPPAPGAGYDHPAWRELISAARQEGRVAVRGAPNPEAREAIPKAFKERFGIEVEWDSSRASDLYSRLEAERLAGLYTMDVVISGNDLADLLQRDWLEPLKPLLVAPEATDLAAWQNDRLPFVDPTEQYLFQLERAVYGSWVINPQLVDETELRTLEDVFNPKWRGKISVDDPTVSGFGQVNAIYLYVRYGEEAIRRLYVDQAPAFSRDDRQIEDWLARGSHPISFAVAPKNLQQMLEQGLPVKDVGTLGGTGWVRGPIMVVLKDAPHPNAARLFVNWLASPEGLQAHAYSERLVPARKDVPHPWLEGIAVPRPGIDYFNADDFTFTIEQRPNIIRRIREVVR